MPVKLSIASINARSIQGSNNMGRKVLYAYPSKAFTTAGPTSNYDMPYSYYSWYCDVCGATSLVAHQFKKVGKHCDMCEECFTRYNQLAEVDKTIIAEKLDEIFEAKKIIKNRMRDMQ